MTRLSTRRLLATVAALGCAACSDGNAPTPHLRPVGRIAFQMRKDWVWDIYTTAPDGSDLKNLTNSAEDDLRPAWSVDHTRIAYESATAPAGIWVMNADGTNKHPILPGYSTQHITWSPDGSRIAFTGSDGSGYKLFVVNADGTNLRDISSGIAFPGMPDWSPDGKRIAFATGGVSNSDIIVMSSDGWGIVNLTPNATHSQETDPAWSPDGSRIAFVSTSHNGTNYEVFTMKADGSDWRRVTDVTGLQADDHQPHWSGDATQIVFDRSIFPSAQVYTVKLGTGALQAIGQPVSGNASW